MATPPKPDPHGVTTREELRQILGEHHQLSVAKIHSELDKPSTDFIRSSPMLFMATADARGRPTVSPRGDRPGFVQVENTRSLVIPERRGNKLLFGLQNLLVNQAVAVIFLVPGTGATLRVEGRATITRDPELLRALEAFGKPALLALRITIEQRYFHCSKSFNRAELWNPETWPKRVPISAAGQVADELGNDGARMQRFDGSIERDDTEDL